MGLQYQCYEIEIISDLMFRPIKLINRNHS